MLMLQWPFYNHYFLYNSCNTLRTVMFFFSSNEQLHDILTVFTVFLDALCKLALDQTLDFGFRELKFIAYDFCCPHRLNE